MTLKINPLRRLLFAAAVSSSLSLVPAFAEEAKTDAKTPTAECEKCHHEKGKHCDKCHDGKQASGKKDCAMCAECKRKNKKHCEHCHDDAAADAPKPDAKEAPKP